ncbi:5-methylcytosine-specific restriction endonuclease system specificity protein McrC [Paracoccus benzoatiresistens]|uniref:5-methylcytosine-specific restriction endonuclease system specificity protein McrC n=1 Tax=Paracoccus benzoatiresistens TaxID=2997341 RepID=A0ABT4J8U4_9RHOB|nr:5-methylcytosine-specific restriction endonuclease system specificity protein McrC [Paracoccus sp. EF6]MCZ0963509.1 5-methylcytosine-specific restriction endonuclease system specificity protein McrC [Paracoccus sp. EF6]
METPLAEQKEDEAVPLALDKIPVRNVWLLFLYASGLARFRDRFEAEVEASPDFESLVARLLCYATEKRLRRNLSFGYRQQEETLRRVRGRIDILESVSHDLFRKGQVACRFEELTINTPRNRLVRAALLSLLGRLDDADLAHRCRTLAHALGRAGVTGDKPSRAEIVSDQIGRHEADDRLIVSLARAVFDLILPTESAGAHSLLKAQRDETEFRKLFEKAIGNFFAAELSREDGWRVYPGKQYKWAVAAASTGIAAYLPIMITDIILENVTQKRRIVIDTKFTEVLTKSQHGASRFKTSHLYQLYAYLRSQEQPGDPLSMSSDGILLYPSVGMDVDEAALIQGHRLRFVTIDLARPSLEVIERLQDIPLRSSFSAGTA